MSLRVKNLNISRGTVELVVSGEVHCNRGERVAVVGESGSGKSLTALSVLKLLPESLKVSGEITVDGKEVLKLKGEELRRFRWEKVAMVFQDPSSSLNPLMTVGEQVEEALIFHGFRGTRKELKEKVVELFKLAQIPEPEKRINAYPHHLSGGLKQRVAIAMALACSPGYLIADEPTTALDVTVQKRILELLTELSQKSEMGVLLITHDMGVVEEFAQKVFVMYSGYTVEEGKKEEILKHPLHPYTEGLIASSPKLTGRPKRRLPAIPGNVPEPNERPSGCPFHPRCKKAEEICRREVPPTVEVEGRRVRCFFPNY